ncbi:MAG: hypothetical protein QME05_03735 [Candidatus Margulisbacteria bacterium]|nr:hypothetical protein [Candidatus Margulisiibacteriota bacterium]
MSRLKEILIIVGWLLLLTALLPLGCSSQSSESTTTSTSTSTTTTSTLSSTTTSTTITTTTTLSPGAIIRLYYTYSPSGSKGNDRAYGCAYSTNGVNFTVESYSLLAADYLTDPDVFKESAGHWVMLYSKATSPSTPSTLFKAICTSPIGSFETDINFIGDLGNICSTLNVNGHFYTYTASSEGINVCSYEAGAPRLSYIRTITEQGFVDPSVIQISANRFILYAKTFSGNTCTAESSDGVNNWTSPLTLFTSAEVPGAVYINNTIYLYYTDFSQSPSPIVVRTSADNGASYSSPLNITGLPESACDPDPVVYE